MVERRGYDRLSQQVGAILTATTLMLGNEQAADTSQEQPWFSAEWASGHDWNDPRNPALAVAVLRPNDGADVLFNKIPGARHQEFQDALTDPTVDLARTSLSAVAIFVTSSSQENGHSQPADSTIQLELNTQESNTSIMSVPGSLTVVLRHESVHALVEKWYAVLAGTATTNDSQLQVRVDRVREACQTVNSGYFRDFFDKSYEQLADAFHAIAVGNFTSYDSGNYVYEAAVEHYKETMDRTSEAVRARQYAAYTGPVYYDQQCKVPTILDAASAVNGAPVPVALVGGIYNAENQALTGAQFVVRQIARQAYKCVTEGNAYEDLIHDDRVADIGHPYDNPTEAAASLFTTLLLNPTYIPRCLSELDFSQAEPLRRYMGAILEASSYIHPELEEIVRRNKDASDIVDWLMATTPSQS